MQATKFTKGMIFLINGKPTNPINGSGYYLITNVKNDVLEVVKMSKHNNGMSIPILFNNHIDYIVTDMFYEVNQYTVRMEQFRGIVTGELEDLLDLIYKLHWANVIPTIKNDTAQSYYEYCKNFYIKFGTYSEYDKSQNKKNRRF